MLSRRWLARVGRSGCVCVCVCVCVCAGAHTGRQPVLISNAAAICGVPEQAVLVWYLTRVMGGDTVKSDAELLR